MSTKRRETISKSIKSEKNVATQPAADEYSAIPKNVLNLISKYATEKAVAIFKEQLRERREKVKDYRLKNTRLLVKKYKWLKNFTGNAVSELTQLLSEEELVYLESLGMESFETRRVESIKDSVIFTNTVLGHIDTMLELYKNKCLSSDREDVQRRWRVLYAMYLSDEIVTPEDVAEQEHINDRTVYKTLNAAIADLSVLFFGIDLSDIFVC